MALLVEFHAQHRLALLAQAAHVVARILLPLGQDPEIEAGPMEFRFLYPDDMPLMEKVETIARKIYQAGAVSTNVAIDRQMAKLEEAGYGKLPVCIAKTQSALTDNPKIPGFPKDGFTITVSSAKVSAGAGFVVIYTGKILAMPGLPKNPATLAIDVDDDGTIVDPTSHDLLAGRLCDRHRRSGGEQCAFPVVVDLRRLDAQCQCVALHRCAQRAGHQREVGTCDLVEAQAKALFHRQALEHPLHQAAGLEQPVYRRCHPPQQLAAFGEIEEVAQIKTRHGGTYLNESLYITGVTSRARKVELSRPPMITQAIGE